MKTIAAGALGRKGGLILTPLNSEAGETGSCNLSPCTTKIISDKSSDTTFFNGSYCRVISLISTRVCMGQDIT